MKTFRTPYEFRGDPTEVGTINDEPTMTNQAESHDTDINVIMKRYSATGQLPRVQGTAPNYGDFSQVDDYQTALETVLHAREEFQKLPADIRRRFANDPQNLLNFVGDEKNRTEAEKLGLLTPKEEPKPSLDATHIVDSLKEHFNGERTDENAGRAGKHRPPRSGKGAD